MNQPQRSQSPDYPSSADATTEVQFENEIIGIQANRETVEEIDNLNEINNNDSDEDDEEIDRLEEHKQFSQDQQISPKSPPNHQEDYIDEGEGKMQIEMSPDNEYFGTHSDDAEGEETESEDNDGEFSPSQILANAAFSNMNEEESQLYRELMEHQRYNTQMTNQDLRANMLGFEAEGEFDDNEDNYEVDDYSYQEKSDSPKQP